MFELSERTDIDETDMATSEGRDTTATTNIVVTKFIENTSDLLEVASTLDLNRKGKIIEVEIIGGPGTEPAGECQHVEVKQKLQNKKKLDDKNDDDRPKRRKRLCARCGEGYVRNHELFCQPSSNSKPIQPVSSAVCSKCGKYFSSNFNLKRHMSSCKLCPDEEKGPRFVCHCGRTYSQECDMKKHQTRCEDEKKKCKPCLMTDCKLLFYHKAQLVQHMKRDHGMKLQDPQLLTFSCFDDFLQWKEQEEAETYTYYSKQTGSNITGVSVNTYYICQHDGSERDHNKTPRKTERRNKKGRIKTGRLCWSQMNVKEFMNGSVKVTYYPSHTHEISIADTKHHPLPMSVNKEIKRRLSLLKPQSEEHMVENGVKKGKKRKYGITLRALKTLARKNRNFFRITNEAVQPAADDMMLTDDDVPITSMSDETVQPTEYLDEKLQNNPAAQEVFALEPITKFEANFLENSLPETEIVNKDSLVKEDDRQQCLVLLEELRGLLNSQKFEHSQVKEVKKGLEELFNKCKKETDDNEQVSCFMEKLQLVPQNDKKVTLPEIIPDDDCLTETNDLLKQDVKPIVDDSGNAVYQILSDGQQYLCQGVELVGAREFILISADQYFQSLNPNVYCEQ